ncbi:MAG: hypothetical protein KatS3mg102_0793 [Planctomycetota bacterium]|nr:MAG: hypothetical protein KatS3mg102_0793 [Planctomycetota bacterium]
MSRAFRPRSLQEAVALLGDPELGAVPVAGCTDLMVLDHAMRRSHRAVVDLLGLAELRGIRWAEGGGSAGGPVVEIGAASTFSAIRADPLVRMHLPILAEAAATIGAWQIQNRATIGGNLANASPAADSAPVLLALDAELVLVGPAGERVVPYRSFHLGYRKTLLAPGELIARIRVPVPVPGTRQRFHKVGTRQAQAISKVVLAMCCRREPDGLLRGVRFGVGSVAPVPRRLRGAEQACEGRPAGAATAERAAAAAAAEVHPIDDVRSTAAYRREVLARLVRRMVLELAADAG